VLICLLVAAAVSTAAAVAAVVLSAGVHSIGNIACEYVLERITNDAISRAPNKS
jgi:hypothetical protein